LLVAILVAGPFAITQTTLDADLVAAQTAWGEQTEISGISAKPMNGCKALADRAGWADLVMRTITINSECRWDPEGLRIAVEHEVGHLLLGSNVHSLDPKSVMYWQLARGQTITPEDREWLRSVHARVRPTILRP
jgi:hypothetical protein